MEKKLDQNIRNEKTESLYLKLRILLIFQHHYSVVQFPQDTLKTEIILVPFSNREYSLSIKLEMSQSYYYTTPGQQLFIIATFMITQNSPEKSKD